MTKPKNVLVTKSSGETAAFSYQKLKKSLAAAGASEAIINTIIPQVEGLLYQGIPTRQIYKKAFALLKGKPGALAARYKLKNAIMELGPSGYPFERFIGELLKSQGYQVSVGQIMKGQCVNHEIDVIATKGYQYFIIECKFHNQSTYQCDVKIPLYIHSRFRDVEAELRKKSGREDLFYQGWVVTNTRFTLDAITYGQCAGLHLLGWNYPEGNSLKELIEKTGIYPLTTLTTLTSFEKQHLLQEKMVLCKDICQKPYLLEELGIGGERLRRILREAYDLCGSTPT
ncbi:MULTISPECIES: restriction endonuclease [Rufibacter]|uniref:ATP-cone domain-containing protein n=1 Tax=Rufibacter quisquiliarum TaxID=1549639 RepID=A0A839GK24_9BACT|nr:MULTISPECIES: restriction endonuclease [Rufibacter]MBA9079212.1 hypothetical protein [Rufibacter quisquiliarum]